MGRDFVGIGLLGMGVVGSGVAKVLSEKAKHLETQIGLPTKLTGVLVRDQNKPRSFRLSPRLVTSNPEELFTNPNVDIIIEVIGGETPALQLIKRGLSQGKHVVTANKEIMARHGFDIMALAMKNSVQVLFEASVGAGTPIISPLTRDLVANNITSIRAIVNGTTNYILTRMANEKANFEEALDQARQLGYAESDPTNDVEGIDAAYKLAILSTLSFRSKVKYDQIYTEGITRLAPADFLYAKELGYTIKLLAIATKENHTVQARVHPTMIPKDEMMAKVDGVLNAVEIETDLAQQVIFHGPGAGSLPTASAVVADVVQIAKNIAGDTAPAGKLVLSENITFNPIDELQTRYYLRLKVSDRPGVLGQIAVVLGELQISIGSVIQKKTDDLLGIAELVLMTHQAAEAAIQQAATQLEALDAVREVSNIIRVEENQKIGI